MVPTDIGNLGNRDVLYSFFTIWQLVETETLSVFWLQRGLKLRKGLNISFLEGEFWKKRICLDIVWFWHWVIEWLMEETDVLRRFGHWNSCVSNPWVFVLNRQATKEYVVGRVGGSGHLAKQEMTGWRCLVVHFWVDTLRQFFNVL